MPPEVFVFSRLDNNRFKIAGLSTSTAPLSIRSLGTGTEHSFDTIKPENKTLIQIDGMIQSPLTNRSIQGSPETPYIFDDRARYDEVAEKISDWYHTSPEERKRRGLLGREYALGTDSMLSSKSMADNFIKGIEGTFENWKKRVLISTSPGYLR